MKIHHTIEKALPELIPIIKKNAKKLGLDKLDYDTRYTLFKLSAKKKSSVGLPDNFLVDSGFVFLIGNESFTSIYLSGLMTWFKTSPIIAFKKSKKGYAFETENSFYELREK